MNEKHLLGVTNRRTLCFRVFNNRQRLINMVHYLPDMHCPSHIYFSKTEFPHYRYNRVLTNGKETSYHGFWDGSPRLDRKEWTIEDYAKNVDKVSRKQIKAWQSGTLEDWGRDIAEAGYIAYDMFLDKTDVAQFRQSLTDNVIQ